MDGNNRWAKARGLKGIAGHKQGVERIRCVLQACDDLGIEILTIFAFSSENWRRPKAEVSALMTLFQSYLKQEVKKLVKDGVRLRVIGRRDRFSGSLQKAIADAEQQTAAGRKTLVIAADYGGQWDIANAARSLAQQVAAGQLAAETIDEQVLGEAMQLADLPAVDLCIRTGGEHRISNFLLWQVAYAELYFTDCYWPDFAAEELSEAVQDFCQRQRRFGMTSDQLLP